MIVTTVPSFITLRDYTEVQEETFNFLRQKKKKNYLTSSKTYSRVKPIPKSACLNLKALAQQRKP